MRVDRITEPEEFLPIVRDPLDMQILETLGKCWDTCRGFRVIGNNKRCFEDSERLERLEVCQCIDRG
jgi:hypothetical protein